MRASKAHAAAVVASSWIMASAGCAGADGGGGDGVVVRDSAGVTIVENPALDPTRVLPLTLDLSVGVVDGDPAYQLFQVSDLALLSDGGLAIANGGSREVRVYGPDGTHRTTFGGAGQGPSEFRYPIAVSVDAADTLRVQDRLDRVWFTADGAFVRREGTSYGDLQELVGPNAASEGGYWLTGEAFLMPIYERGGSPEPGPPFRPQVTLAVATGGVTAIDTLGRYGGILQQVVDVGGPRPSYVVPPFGTNTSWAVGAGDGSVAIGDNSAPEIRVFGLAGGRRIVRWRAEPRPVTDTEVSEALDRQRGMSWAQGRLPELERGWAAMDVPDHHPFYGEVALGRDGSLWASRSSDFSEVPSTFLVFDADGRYLGAATVPGRFRILDAGPDWIAGVHLDEADIELARVYRIADGATR